MKRFLFRLLLLGLGIFCVFIPRMILRQEYLRSRYDRLDFMGDIFVVVGLVIVLIATVALVKQMHDLRSG